MTLHEALARLKNKWKQRIGIAPTNVSGPASTLASPPSSPPPPKPTRATFAISDAPQVPIQISQSGPEVMQKSPPDETSSAWTTLGSILGTLESSADVFGPLKSAINGLKGLVDAHENARRQHKEYDELWMRLGLILTDLADHIEQPIGLRMTNGVKLIYKDLEEESNKVAEKQARATGRRLIDAMEELSGIEESYRRIGAHLQRLMLNTSLNMLKEINEQTMESRLTRMCPSMSAVYNSAESSDVQRGACAPGTRQAQIALLLEWTSAADDGKTCWMNGMAGTGKTTITYSVCKELEITCRLGASFFCSRTIPECRQVRYIIPSLAYQLAEFSLPFRCALSKALELDRDAHTRALDVQYQKLIVEPLTEVKDSLPADFIVVIDALDECENEDAVGQILELLLSAKYTLPIRYLISSRPEKEITRRITGRLDGQEEARLVLHNFDSIAVSKDIEAYMRAELKDVPLTEAQWQRLIDCCGALFIYASTTCRYIKQANELMTLNEAVGVITSSWFTQRDRNAIDDLYKIVLDDAFNKAELDDMNKQRMKDVLETVVCAIEPMTVGTIAKLLGLESGAQVDRLLLPLRSVLNVTKTTGLVTTLHASFPEFILSFDRSKSYHCQSRILHFEMARVCLRLIDTSESKFNICALPSSHLLDSEIEDLDARVSRLISPALTYACRYWSTHLRLGEYRVELLDCVSKFLSSRLLLWMEILNLTKHMRYGPTIIQDAEKWCIQQKVPEHLTKLAHDAWQFASFYAHHPLSQSTPHIYVSMLPFWPPSRPISTAYMPRTSGVVQPAGTAIDRRQLLLIATWQVSTHSVNSIALTNDGARLVATTRGSIEVLDTITGESLISLSNERIEHTTCVAISPDGTKVAFGGYSSTLHVWNISNRDEITQPLPDGTSGVASIEFSPDGSCIACGMNDGDVYICGLQQEARSRGPLHGHNRGVNSVAFSPNSSYLASGSQDRTVRVWNVQTGELIGQPFEGHADSVSSVSFSSDGLRLASSSIDGTIRVWDSETGRVVLESLTGYSRLDYTVSLLPNGSVLATACLDQSIILCNARIDRTVHGPIDGHTSDVNLAICSPDRTRLFSCSRDGTVRVWNLQDVKAPRVQSPASAVTSSITSIRYSHDGSRVASGSEDGAVHVRDVQTGKAVLGPLRGHGQVITSVDYSPEDGYIASGSYDATVRIWDASTGQDIHGPMRGHDGCVNCVRFSTDSSVVFSGSDDGTVRVWDVSTGQQVAELFRGDDPIRSVGISPDGQLVACGFKDGCIRVVDRNTGDTLVGPIQAHSYDVDSVDFSPSGMRLASGSYDSVKIWDVQTGDGLVVCGNRDNFNSRRINSVSFSLNGLYVASGSKHQTVCVWDARNGNLILGPLKGHTDRVTGVQFSPDGSHIVSCSCDRTIRFWDVSYLETKLQQGAAMGADQGEDASTRPHSQSVSDLWSLNDDGWLVDSDDRRLLWVPSDLCPYFVFPPTSLLIVDQGSFQIGTDGWKNGDVWADCYRP